MNVPSKRFINTRTNAARTLVEEGAKRPFPSSFEEGRISSEFEQKTILNEWLAEYRSPATRSGYRTYFAKYCRRFDTTPENIIAEFRTAEDKVVWAKEQGLRILKWKAVSE